MFSSVVVGVRAPQEKAPSCGGLYLIKASCAQSAHGRSCGSMDASGDVIIMIIIIFCEVIEVSMAVREESWASYLGSSSLLDFGVCHGPFLIAEGAVATAAGIDDRSPNSRSSSVQLQVAVVLSCSWPLVWQLPYQSSQSLACWHCKRHRHRTPCAASRVDAWAS